jgi:hypothetical protein
MNGELLAVAIVAGGFFALITVIIALTKQRKKPLNIEYFTERWGTVQKQCGKKDTWPLAIIDGDKLLDEALKKRGYKGKTMGERLVAAQREISDNDGVWFAHKLRNRLVHEHDVKLDEEDVKDAMLNFRAGLRDLGALRK